VPALQWDQVGDRRFEAGVDRGVLYLGDDAVAWNGLTGVDESPNTESRSFYQDGVKVLDVKVLGEYAATLKAYTYPDEFDQVLGIANDGKGLFIHDQRPRPFDLCYRTRIGNDVDGIDHGYRLHLLYSLMAVPNGTSFGTTESNVSPVEFSWALTSTPQDVTGYRPTAHLSIKSTDIDPGYMNFIESILYGTETSEAYLPSPTEMFDLIANRVTIVDNGDGTWTAQGSDRVVQDLGNGAYLLQGVQSTVDPDGDFTITIPAY
jgi:hypothetical protein